MTSKRADSQSRLLTSDPLIFFSTIILVILILLAALFDLNATRTALLGLEDFIVEQFSWLFSMTVTCLLVFSVWIGLSRYGRIRLGPDESTPEYSTYSWLAMLFSAGMGIGLVFYGVAEPVLHFLNPPNSTPMTANAAREAMRISIFHWGLHAWAIYVVLGLALAYFHFRHNEPLAIRSALRPLLGRRTHTFPGKIIDTLAVLGTLFGLATSLGLGAAQINAGLHRLFGTEITVNSEILIIVCVTFCATMSLVMGLDKGIRRLSEFNILLACLLLLFVLFAGPTAALIRGLPDLFGNYLQGLIGMSLRTAPFRSLEWQKTWTIFYWAWWISWAPFVGTFIARISRGRTIKEFVFGVLIIPTLMSMIWFDVFGGAALRVEIFGSGDIAAAVQENSAIAIYKLLEHYPWQSLSSFLAVMLVAVFFITSSDSGSFVVDMLTSGGKPNPPVWQRIFWASTEGMLAIVLLIIGGLKALQAGAVSMGLPFCLVMVAIMISMVKELREDWAVNPAVMEPEQSE